MKIIHASRNCSNLQFLLQPLQFPSFTPLRRRYSQSSPTTCTNFHRPISLTPQTPPLHSLRKPPLLSSTTTTHSLPDDAASGSAAVTVVDVDPSLAVKKKATEISPELKGTSIFLVGINSTMKTSLGKLLANSLRYYYFDSESLVEEAAGDAAAKSLKERDEEGFRESETEVLKQLSSLGRLVVCTGNGAVQSSTNLALLRHGISIWIDVPLDMVAEGVVADGFQVSAPQMSTSGSYSEVLTQLTAMYEEMRDGYATADVTISLQKVAWQLGYDHMDAVTAEDIALEVLKEIEKLTRVKKMLEEAARPF